MNIANMKNRKVILVCLFFIASSVYLFLDKLTGELWVEFMKWLWTAYIIGNGAEHYSSAIKNGKLNNS